MLFNDGSVVRQSAKNLLQRGELRSQSLFTGHLKGVLNRFESSSLFRKQKSLSRGPSTSSKAEIRETGKSNKEIPRVSSSKLLVKTDKIQECRKPTVAVLNKSRSYYQQTCQTHESVDNRDSSTNNSLTRGSSQQIVKKILSSGRQVSTKRSFLKHPQFLVGIRNPAVRNTRHEPSLERAFLHEHNRVGDLRQRPYKHMDTDTSKQSEEITPGSRRITQEMKSRALMAGSSSQSPQKRLTSYKHVQQSTRNVGQLEGNLSNGDKNDSFSAIYTLNEEVNAQKVIYRPQVGLKQQPPLQPKSKKPQIIAVRNSQQSFLASATNLRSASSEVANNVKQSRSVKNTQGQVSTMVNNYMSNHSNRGISDVDKSQERTANSHRKPIIVSKLAKYMNSDNRVSPEINEIYQVRRPSQGSSGAAATASITLTCNPVRKLQHRQPRQSKGQQESKKEEEGLEHVNVHLESHMVANQAPRSSRAASSQQPDKPPKYQPRSEATSSRRLNPAIIRDVVTSPTGLTVATNQNIPKAPIAYKASKLQNISIDNHFPSPQKNASKPPRHRSNSKNVIEVETISRTDFKYQSTDSKASKDNSPLHRPYQASRKPPPKALQSDKKTKLYSATKNLNVSPARQGRGLGHNLAMPKPLDEYKGQKTPQIKLYEPSRKQATMQQLFHNAKQAQKQKTTYKIELLDAASPDKRPSFSKSQAKQTQTKQAYKKKSFLVVENTRNVNRPRKSEKGGTYKSPQKKVLPSTATITALNQSYRKNQPKKPAKKHDLATISNAASSEYYSNTSQTAELPMQKSCTAPYTVADEDNLHSKRQQDIMSKIQSNIKRSEELDMLAAQRAQKEQRKQSSQLEIRDSLIAQSRTERKVSDESEEPHFGTFSEVQSPTHAHTVLKGHIDFFPKAPEYFGSLDRAADLDSLQDIPEAEITKPRNRDSTVILDKLEEYKSIHVHGNKVPERGVIRATGSIDKRKVSTPSELEETLDEVDIQPISARNDVQILLSTPMKKQKSSDYHLSDILEERPSIVVVENSPENGVRIDPPVRVEDPNFMQLASLESEASPKNINDSVEQQQIEVISEISVEKPVDEVVRVSSFKESEQESLELQQTTQEPKKQSPKRSRPRPPLKVQDFLKAYDDVLFETEKEELVSGEYEMVYYAGDIPQRQPLLPGEAEMVLEFDDSDGYYEFTMDGQVRYRYQVLSLLGKGSFAQVVCVLDHATGEKFALKMNRNTELDHKFAESEANLLKFLMDEDKNDEVNIVRMYEHTIFRNHQCFFFELLHCDLFEFLKENEFSGFQEETIKEYTKQILNVLAFLEERSIIHCDLKPENIVMCDKSCTQLKVVDFGSGCLVDQQTYTYVQSRFYRSPEVLLRIPYTEKVDIWSLGCILAELFTGEPLFPGNNEQEQLEYIMEVKGIPPDSMIDKSRKKDHYFDTDYSPYLIEDDEYGILRIPENRRLRVAVPSGDKMFINFLGRCLDIDPEVRMSAREALNHPWITEDPAEAALLLDSEDQQVHYYEQAAEQHMIEEQENEEDEPAGELINKKKQHSDGSANSNITASFVSGEPQSETVIEEAKITSASVRNAEDEPVSFCQEEGSLFEPAILPSSEAGAPISPGTVQLVGVYSPSKKEIHSPSKKQKSNDKYK